MPFDMSSHTALRRTFLPRRSTLVLDDAAGTIIAVEHGCLWITLERDPRDIVLLPGMRFEIDRDGRTVAAAEQDTRLRLISTSSFSQRARASLAEVAARVISDWSRRLERKRAPYF